MANISPSRRDSVVASTSGEALEAAAMGCKPTDISFKTVVREGGLSVGCDVDEDISGTAIFRLACRVVCGEIGECGKSGKSNRAVFILRMVKVVTVMGAMSAMSVMCVASVIRWV
jgi:hypothetical protein